MKNPNDTSSLTPERRRQIETKSLPGVQCSDLLGGIPKGFVWVKSSPGEGLAVARKLEDAGIPVTKFYITLSECKSCKRPGLILPQDGSPLRELSVDDFRVPQSESSVQPQRREAGLVQRLVEVPNTH